MNNIIADFISEKAEIIREDQSGTLRNIVTKLRDSHGLMFYPSSGSDFKDLLVNKQIFDKNGFSVTSSGSDLKDLYLPNNIGLPDVILHNDYMFSSPHIFRKGTDLLSDSKSGKHAIVTDSIELKFNHGSLTHLDPAIVHFPRREKYTGCIFICTIELRGSSNKTEEKILIYTVLENNALFESLMLGYRQHVSHLINIRDGSGCGGGGNVNCRHFELYLGLLHTKYLVSDNHGREPLYSSLILKRKAYKDALTDTENTPYVLEHVGELKWSHYGIFLGDAFVSKVHHLKEMLK